MANRAAGKRFCQVSRRIWLLPSELIALAKELIDVDGERLHRYDPAPASVRSVEVALPALTVLPDPFGERFSGDAFTAEKFFLR